MSEQLKVFNQIRKAQRDPAAVAALATSGPHLDHVLSVLQKAEAARNAINADQRFTRFGRSDAVQKIRADAAKAIEPTRAAHAAFVFQRDGRVRAAENGLMSDGAGSYRYGSPLRDKIAAGDLGTLARQREIRDRLYVKVPEILQRDVLYLDAISTGDEEVSAAMESGVSFDPLVSAGGRERGRQMKIDLSPLKPEIDRLTAVASDLQYALGVADNTLSLSHGANEIAALDSAGLTA